MRDEDNLKALAAENAVLVKLANALFAEGIEYEEEDGVLVVLWEGREVFVSAMARREPTSA